jgi:hypothetical protein
MEAWNDRTEPQVEMMCFSLSGRLAESSCYGAVSWQTVGSRGCNGTLITSERRLQHEWYRNGGKRRTRRYSRRFSQCEGLPVVDVMNVLLASRVVDVRLTGNVLKGKATTARQKVDMTCIRWKRIGMFFVCNSGVRLDN